MVKHCTNLAKKTQRAQFKMVSSFVNSTDIRSTPEKLLEHISKMIGKNALKNDRQKLESALTTGKSKGPVVLIIDEIDFLCCSQASNKKEESVLDTIFRWTSDVENRLVVIGITNSVGDDIARSLHDKVEVCYKQFTLLSSFSIKFYHADVVNSFLDTRRSYFPPIYRQ